MCSPLDIREFDFDDLVEAAEALWSLGWLDPADQVYTADQALARHIDGSALCELAGLDNPDRRNANPLFRRALNEMGRPPISHETAARRAACLTARGIVDGSIDPYAGASLLALISCELEHPDDLTTFVVDVDDYEDLPDRREEIVQSIMQSARELLDE